MSIVLVPSKRLLYCKFDSVSTILDPFLTRTVPLTDHVSGIPPFYGCQVPCLWSHWPRICYFSFHPSSFEPLVCLYPRPTGISGGLYNTKIRFTWPFDNLPQLVLTVLCLHSPPRHPRVPESVGRFTWGRGGTFRNVRSPWSETLTTVSWVKVLRSENESMSLKCLSCLPLWLCVSDSLMGRSYSVLKCVY